MRTADLLSLVALWCALCTGQEFVSRQTRTPPKRAYPGSTCFPEDWEFDEFGKQIQGEIVTFKDSEYAEQRLMYNVRVTRNPYVLVFPETVKDIQETIMFVKTHRLHLAVRSTGHSFIGRSTFHGSVNMDLSKMRGMKINLNDPRNADGTITVQTGLHWIDIYRKVDTVGRVVVGSSGHTVSPGGYTLGGGHSPVSRSLGLAIDNLLAASIVTADGSLKTVNETHVITEDIDGNVDVKEDRALFWALRGGGGGTWGVVYNFTYKLHLPPQRVRNVLLVWGAQKGEDDSMGREVLRQILRRLSTMSSQWGGYLLTSPEKVELTDFYGSLTLFLNHYGSDSDPSNSEIDELKRLSIQKNLVWQHDINYPTFLGYEETAKDPPVTNAYLANIFVQPSDVATNESLASFADVIFDGAKGQRIGCTGTMIGGVSRSFPPGATSVHPGFRSGFLSLSCAKGWEYNLAMDDVHINEVLRFAQRLYEYGDGTYFNECAADMDDWKTRFWKSMETYTKLLGIKMEVDPELLFWCHNCVGSDEPTFLPDECTVVDPWPWNFDDDGPVHAGSYSAGCTPMTIVLLAAVLGQLVML